MAIININPVTKSSLDNTITNTANEIERCIARWNRLADQINELSTADLTALGYEETEMNYIGTFRGALIDLHAAFNNEAVSGSDPSYVVGLLSDPIVW